MIVNFMYQYIYGFFAFVVWLLFLYLTVFERQDWALWLGLVNAFLIFKQNKRSQDQLKSEIDQKVDLRIISKNKSNCQN